MPHNNKIPDAKLKFINGVSKNIPYIYHKCAKSTNKKI